jgi:hypothetical protein
MKRFISKTTAITLWICLVSSSLSAPIFAASASKNPALTELSSKNAAVSPSGKTMSVEDEEIKSPEALKAEIEAERAKTDRYIIKLKDSAAEEILADIPSRLELQADGDFNGNLEPEKAISLIKSGADVKDAVRFALPEDSESEPEKLLAVTLDERVDFEKFIEDELSVNSNIEYIQPDYKMPVSDLDIGLSLIDGSVWEEKELVRTVMSRVFRIKFSRTAESA